MQHDDVDRSNLDDASAFYGLSHSATDAAPTLTEGNVWCRLCQREMTIVESYAHFEETGHRTAGNPNLSSPYWNVHENKRLEEEARLRGEVLLEAANPGKRDPNASNVGAYDTIEARIAELVAEGNSALKAAAIANRESGSVDRQIEPERPRAETYLGASIDELMKAPSGSISGGGQGNKAAFVTHDGAIVAMVQYMGAKPGGGGSGGGGGRSRKPRLTDSQLRDRRYQRIMSDVSDRKGA